MSGPRFWAIVPAAGIGQRMRSDVPKQYLELKGRIILEYAVNSLLSHPWVKVAVVCIAPQDNRWDGLGLSHDSRVRKVDGGETRAQSVLNGLRSLTGEAGGDDWVLVHDAARPCLPAELLARLLSELQDDDVGGILAVPARDTIKTSAGQSDSTQARISETLDRRHIWLAQTPQMFRYELLMQALEQALDQDIEITDEASAMEHAGFRPRLIESDTRNIKITTPDDLDLVEWLLRNL